MIATLTTVIIATALAATPTTTPEWHMDKPHKGTHATPVREAAAIPSKAMPFAKCVAYRETGITNLNNRQSREDAQNPRSSASGRWQFLNTQWQHGGSFMVRDRLIDHGMPKQKAKEVRHALGDTPIHKWDGWFQDVLFNEVIARGGWKHWAGSKTCDALVP